MKPNPDSVRLYDENTKLELQIAGYQFAMQETEDEPADGASAFSEVKGR